MGCPNWNSTMQDCHKWEADRTIFPRQFLICGITLGIELIWTSLLNIQLRLFRWGIRWNSQRTQPWERCKVEDLEVRPANGTVVVNRNLAAIPASADRSSLKSTAPFPQQQDMYRMISIQPVNCWELII